MLETILAFVTLEKVWMVITSIVTIASVIVKLTPTTKDDEILSKVMKFLEWVSLNKKQ